MSVRTAVDEVDKGAFKRVDSSFRSVVSDDPDNPFKPQSGRYHLYISNACPWANRCSAVREMKGLESTITMSIVHPTWQYSRPGQDGHSGWCFKDPENDSDVIPITGKGSISCKGCIPDTINGAQFVRDLYDLAGDTNGKYTVPILWDKELKTIVNNESSEILRMLNGPFAKLVGSDKTTPDLYPEPLRSGIDSVNEWIYNDINNGVYKCGFAQSQAAYEEAFNALFAALDRVEAILASQRYAASTSAITEADIRLFMTLIRFDSVYVVYFKCNRQFLSSYTNIHNYMRELYAMPFIKNTTDITHIKNHYFTSHGTLNAYSIVPIGPNVLLELEQKHDRERFNN